MFSNEIIAQLKQNDWIIECESAEKVDWLLQACEEAGIKCRSGRRATKFKPNAQRYPIIIIYSAKDKTIHQGMENKAGTLVSFFVKEMGYKNITDWFFNAIKGETIVINEQLIEQVIDRLWQVANELNKDKDNEQVIERLKKSCWYVVCETVEEVDLLLQVCKKAGMIWDDGEKATEFKPYEHDPLPFYICYCNHDRSIFYVTDNNEDYSEKNGYENITDWLFNAVKGENNG